MCVEYNCTVGEFEKRNRTWNLPGTLCMHSNRDDLGKLGQNVPFYIMERGTPNSMKIDLVGGCQCPGA